MRRARFVLIGLVLALVTVLGLGCRKEAARKIGERLIERQLEHAGAKKADVDLGTTDLSALPAMFHYPNAIGRGKVAGDEGDARFENWVMETNDPAAMVVAWYKNSLSSWKKGVTSEFGKVSSLNYQSPDEKQAVAVVVAQDEKVTRMNLSLKTRNK